MVRTFGNITMLAALIAARAQCLAGELRTQRCPRRGLDARRCAAKRALVAVWGLRPLAALVAGREVSAIYNASSSLGISAFLPQGATASCSALAWAGHIYNILLLPYSKVPRGHRQIPRGRLPRDNGIQLHHPVLPPRKEPPLRRRRCQGAGYMLGTGTSLSCTSTLQARNLPQAATKGPSCTVKGTTTT